jgi:hypothetical protein
MPMPAAYLYLSQWLISAKLLRLGVFSEIPLRGRVKTPPCWKREHPNFAKIEREKEFAINTRE